MKRFVALMMCAMPFTVIVSQENITVEAEYIEAVNGMYKYHLYVYTPTSEYALSSIYGDEGSPLTLYSDGGFYDPVLYLNSDTCSVWAARSGFTMDCLGVSAVSGNDDIPEDNYHWNSFIGTAVYRTSPVEAGLDGRILIGKFTTFTVGIEGIIPLQFILPGVINDLRVSVPVVTTTACDGPVGCMNPNACNWDAEAECPDNSCIYEDECGVCGGNGIPEGSCDCEGSTPAQGYDCDGMCLGDTDGDGVCDEFEIEGCQDQEACNFNPNATDASTCDYACLVTESLELAGVLDFSTPSGGVSGKAIHFRAKAHIEDLSVFGVGIANNGGGSDGQEFSFPHFTMSEGETILIARDIEALQSYFGSCWDEFSHIIQASGSIDQNGNDAIELYEYGQIIETYGDPNINLDGTSLDYQDSWAYKFLNDGWVVAETDCTDGSETIFESSCPYPICENLGCTNSSACNYEETATQDDDSCIYIDDCGVCGGNNNSCSGCTDAAACNYSETSTIEDGSCIYNDDCGVCGGDNTSCSGCMHENATNYDATATIEDGSCLYSQDAFDAGVALSDPSEVVNCDSVYNPDYDHDGFIGINDILGILPHYDLEWPLWHCGDPLEYQGYDYETVQIGEQCWFAENLRAEKYRNGDVIPNDLSNNQWINATEGALSVYGNGDLNLSIYGRLYNWFAATDERALCPNGWHVPADSEWTALTDGLGGDSIAGEKIKATDGWNGTNSSGFSGLPGGNRRDSDGNFYFLGHNAFWWSTTIVNDKSVDRSLGNHTAVIRSETSPQYGHSVRCIKDAE